MPEAIAAALIALGVKEIELLAPEVAELIGALIRSAVRALTEDDKPDAPPKRDVLVELVSRTRTIIARLDETILGDGPDKRDSALRVLSFWNSDNGNAYSASELALALELVFQEQRQDQRQEKK